MLFHFYRYFMTSPNTELNRHCLRNHLIQYHLRFHIRYPIVTPQAYLNVWKKTHKILFQDAEEQSKEILLGPAWTSMSGGLNALTVSNVSKCFNLRPMFPGALFRDRKMLYNEIIR